jgi:hypothetical protein
LISPVMKSMVFLSGSAMTSGGPALGGVAIHLRNPHGLFALFVLVFAIFLMATRGASSIGKFNRETLAIARNASTPHYVVGAMASNFTIIIAPRGAQRLDGADPASFTALSEPTRMGAEPLSYAGKDRTSVWFMHKQCRTPMRKASPISSADRRTMPLAARPISFYVRDQNHEIASTGDRLFRLVKMIKASTQYLTRGGDTAAASQSLPRYRMSSIRGTRDIRIERLS